ncbi:MAG: hypothetical protein ACKPEQ_22535, partial [Dolichospermum sp.]
LAQQLMLDLQKKSIMKDINYVKQGILKIQFFSPKLSKHIIDEIDKILAEHYGFTEEELDFIINNGLQPMGGVNMLMFFCCFSSLATIR